MSRFKVLAFIALITLAFGVALVGDALAGEKVKARTVLYRVNWQQIEVGDQKGHVYVLYESKGIETILQGKAFCDGWSLRQGGFLDINLKSGAGYAHGFEVMTDKDGDKIFDTWEGKPGKGGLWEGTWTYTGGTGKWQGIQGRGTWITHEPAPGQSYDDWEGEVELPRR
jgi:hypothetical protein